MATTEKNLACREWAYLYLMTGECPENETCEILQDLGYIPKNVPVGGYGWMVDYPQPWAKIAARILARG